jgi:hypothetical protein
MKITSATMARMMRIVHNIARLRPVEMWRCSVGIQHHWGVFPADS